MLWFRVLVSLRIRIQNFKSLRIQGFDDQTLYKTLRNIVLFTQNLSLSYQKYGLGSEIPESGKTFSESGVKKAPDPGSSVKKAPDPGSKRHRSPDSGSATTEKKDNLVAAEKTEVLLLPDLAADTVLRLLRFLYLGVVTIGRHHIGDFLDLVEQWGISPRVTILPLSAAVAAEAAPATPALVGSC